MTVKDPTVTPGQASSGRLLLDQIRYAVVAQWRSRVVLIFTIAMPVVWLMIIGIVAGNETADPSTGVRVMQFAAPTAVSMGTFYAAFPTVAIALAEARESRVLKRVRGTPLPAWTYLWGQIAAAVIFGLVSLLITLVLSVTIYGVEIRAQTALALATTLVIGMASFAAAGLAIAAIATSAAMAQAASIGSAVVLSFISGLYIVGGTLPAWLDTVASIFPLKPYTRALQDQFNPFLDGSGWDVGALGILIAWGVVSSLVAVKRFRWEPHRSRSRSPEAQRRPLESAPQTAAKPLTATVVEPPSSVRVVGSQAAAAAKSTWRRPGELFFSVLVPVGLFALLVTTQGNGTLADGLPVATFTAASMVTWGCAVTAFMNLGESVTRARDRAVLKRVRGTPMSAAQFLAGTTAAAVGLSIAIMALVLVTGVLAFGVVVSPAGLALGLGVTIVGTLSLAACGFLLSTLVPNARAVGAVGLVILFVLAFFSDVFITGGPEWMRTVGSVFPLKHMQNALVAAWDPAGTTVPWVNLLVMGAWGIGAGVLAVRLFRWEPRRS